MGFATRLNTAEFYAAREQAAAFETCHIEAAEREIIYGTVFLVGFM